MNNFYRVERGDTILKIANTLKIPPKKIISENNLKRELEAGDLLVVTIPENTYVVKANETIESVAKKFGVSAQEIMEKNEIEYVFYGLSIII